jgi:outer membrane protein
MNRNSILLVSLLISSGAFGQGREETLSLEAAIRRAVERAPDVALAASQAARAGETVRETRALNRPQAVTGTGLAYNNGFPISIEGSSPSIFQVAVTQSILSKKNNNLIREAEEGLKASQIAPEAARNDLAARTALVYYDLHRTRLLETVGAQRAESARRARDVVASLVEAGKARPVDLTLSRAAVAAAEQQLLAVRERARVSELELRQLLGLEPSVTIRTQEPRLDLEALERPVETLYQRALETSPEIRQAEIGVRAREFHVEAERGEYFPRLELVTEYALFSRHNNFRDFFNRFTRNNVLLGLSVQVPIFNGHKTSARVAASRQELQEAKFRLERQKTDLRLQLERGASQLRVARGAAELARLESAAAEENLKVQESLFEGGRIGARDVEAARQGSHEKEIASVDADRALWQNQIELLRLSGTLLSLF